MILNIRREEITSFSDVPPYCYANVGVEGKLQRCHKVSHHGVIPVHSHGGCSSKDTGNGVHISRPVNKVVALFSYGYQVNHWPGRNMFFGGAHAVGMGDGALVAAGDERRGGSVAVID